MKLSLSSSELKEYTSKQLNNLFPDKYHIDLHDYSSAFDLAIQKLEFCYKHVQHIRYNKSGETILNHLYSDHYLMYIWFLSNTVWTENANENLSNKLYYLNKTLHSFDCMYDTKLPDIFLIFHGECTMLGKAEYSDFFVALHGCTVGSQKGKYPKFGKGVSLTAHCAVIGDSTIGNRVSLSVNTTIFEKNIDADSIAYKDTNTGGLIIKKTDSSYAQQFFNVDLKSY